MGKRRKREKLVWSKRGVRRKQGYGLYYYSKCRRYTIYKSDQVDGVKVPTRWLAYHTTIGVWRLISRHEKRPRAEKACENHLHQKNLESE